MPGGSTQQQNQNQIQNQNLSGTNLGNQSFAQSQTGAVNPWAPTQGLLKNILAQLGGQSTAVTPEQTAAANALWTGASGIQNFMPQANTLAGNLFGATATNAPIMSNAYGAYTGELQPYLSASYLNPMSNPYLGQALATTNQDITNQINSQFAAAGRDLSPANTQALARGLSQGEAGLLTGQYNTNVANQLGAAGSAFGAGGTTAEGLTGLQQTALTNQLQGAGLAGQLPTLAAAPGMGMLNAANVQQQLPYQNIGLLQSLVQPLAGLGRQTYGTTTGTGTSSDLFNQAGTGISSGQGVTQQQTSPISNIIGGGLGALGLLGGTGAFGSQGWLSNIFSDARVKDNIQPVGMLFDGTPVHSFQYKGDPTPRIGLIAQEVEQRQPDAVTEVGGPGGIKALDYGKATARARSIGGMLTGLIGAGPRPADWANRNPGAQQAENDLEARATRAATAMAMGPINVAKQIMAESENMRTGGGYNPAPVVGAAGTAYGMLGMPALAARGAINPAIVAAMRAAQAGGRAVGPQAGQ